MDGFVQTDSLSSSLNPQFFLRKALKPAIYHKVPIGAEDIRWRIERACEKMKPVYYTQYFV